MGGMSHSYQVLISRFLWSISGFHLDIEFVFGGTGDLFFCGTVFHGITDGSDGKGSRLLVRGKHTLG